MPFGTDQHPNNGLSSHRGPPGWTSKTSDAPSSNILYGNMPADSLAIVAHREIRANSLDGVHQAFVRFSRAEVFDVRIWREVVLVTSDGLQAFVGIVAVVAIGDGVLIEIDNPPGAPLEVVAQVDLNLGDHVCVPFVGRKWARRCFSPKSQRLRHAGGASAIALDHPFIRVVGQILLAIRVFAVAIGKHRAIIAIAVVAGDLRVVLAWL
ncbi:MAG: hypothetical protein BZ138_06425 [Methanosphaera sp. rholeuAM270]|nr:MAG: hypothetical protein BZ138_06425 [Methanosphaera sp. rholeuAM270]